MAKNDRAPLILRAVALVLVGGLAASNVDAQHAGAISLGMTVERHSPAPEDAMKLSDTLATDPTSGRPNRTARGALIGAGIGAGTGIVAALIATHASGVTDHSEDGWAYISFSAIGAFIGLVVGGIVGFVRN